LPVPQLTKSDTRHAMIGEHKYILGRLQRAKSSDPEIAPTNEYFFLIVSLSHRSR